MLRAVEREIAGFSWFEVSQRKSGELFEKVFACQPDAVLILDNKCIPNVVDCNPATEKIFGYGRDELVGQPVSLLHADGKVLKEFKQAIVKSVSEQGYCYFAKSWKRRRDGTLFPCEYTVTPLVNDAGEGLGWVSVAHDIARSVEREQALIESAEKIKHFTYSISHDLKNPAIALRWFADRLSDRYGLLLDEHGSMCCDRIRKASEEIFLFVESLNQYITTKELPLSIDSIDLDELFQIVKEEFSQRGRALGVRLSAPECKVKLRADRMCMVRALRNLIENALKHGGERLTDTISRSSSY